MITKPKYNEVDKDNLLGKFKQKTIDQLKSCNYLLDLLEITEIVDETKYRQIATNYCNEESHYIYIGYTESKEELYKLTSDPKSTKAESSWFKLNEAPNKLNKIKIERKEARLYVLCLLKLNDK